MRAHIVLAALLAIAVPAANAASEIRTQRVKFARGANSAVVEGSITGYETVDYVLGAGKGQYMNVSMATKNTATYFNILAPGESEVAFFNRFGEREPVRGDTPSHRRLQDPRLHDAQRGAAQ